MALDATLSDLEGSAGRRALDAVAALPRKKKRILTPKF